MDTSEFLKSIAATSPITWNNETNIVRAAHARLDAFVELVSQLECDYSGDLPALRDKAEKGGRLLITALELSMHGKVGKAHRRFEEGIESLDIQTYTWKFCSRPHQPRDVWFRLRRSSQSTLARRDLVHIPFELRHRVATERFSIPGIPCLYTSGSTYTCWEEMGRPPFHELHATALRLSEGESFRILDLRLTAATLHMYLQSYRVDPRNEDERRADNGQHLRNFISAWPVTALCTMRVKERGGVFKPEYILPQMVMQWVSETESIDGVAYQSTHLKPSSMDTTRTLANYAFPAKDVADTGVCGRLSRKFRMTPPVAWSLLRAVTTREQYPANYYEIDPHPALKALHIETDFGHIESCLRGMVEYHHANDTGDDGSIT